jgi:hypothetical protein
VPKDGAVTFIDLPEVTQRSTPPEVRKLLNTTKRQLSTLIDDVPISCSISEYIDLLKTGTYEVVSQRPGFFFVPLFARFFHKVTTGAAGTPPTVSAGNNGAVDNVIAAAAAPSNADFGLGAPQSTPLTLRTNFALIDMATPILAHVATAATGPTAWSGRLHIVGYYFR